jgi:hypothetical protein
VFPHLVALLACGTPHVQLANRPAKFARSAARLS